MKGKVHFALRSAGCIPAAVAVMLLCIGCAAPSRFVTPPLPKGRGETSKQLLPRISDYLPADRHGLLLLARPAELYNRER